MEPLVERTDLGWRESKDHVAGVGWRKYRMPSRAMLVDVPMGSKIAPMECPVGSGRLQDRLIVYYDKQGLDPHTVASLCRHGERGFGMATNMKGASC